ncbi:MAG: NifB/NifX family molybdenum-iron cluster-binding protein [Desulfuromonadaceae bacterium]|nr:NifB/NifX family molybdenum-iron cluster-binding protein [Desulfuromonadaceae bacterium]
MKIAIPTANDLLAMHFGHCETFTLVTVDPEQKSITAQETVEAPPHEPGLLPRWLAQQDVNLIIAGGMGNRAQDLFRTQGIEVIVGAPAKKPAELAQIYLHDKLTPGTNLCDH